jgi:hypothetical protein
MYLLEREGSVGDRKWILAFWPMRKGMRRESKIRNERKAARPAQIMNLIFVC